MEWLLHVRDFTNESFLAQLVVIITFVKLFGALSDKLGQPTVFGKLLVGIILGPSLLGLIRETETIRLLAELGVIILMFLAGLETDVEEFKKAGYAASLTAVGGVLVPMIAGTMYAMSIGYSGYVPLFIGTVLTATSVSISAQTLRELGKLRSKPGLTILGAAVIDDVLGIIVLTFVLSLAGAGASAGDGGALEVTRVVIQMAAFFLLSIYLGKMIIKPLLKKIRRFPVAQGLISGAFIIVFLYSFVAEAAGVANITGAYIAGILMGTTKYRDEITQKAEVVGYSFLIPIFFTYIGLQADLGAARGEILFIFILSLIAILTKIIGCGAGARVSGFNWKQSAVIGTGMISRGEIALIIAALGLSNKLIDSSLYTALIVMVLISTIVTPPLLKVLVRWSEGKVVSHADKDGL